MNIFNKIFFKIKSIRSLRDISSMGQTFIFSHILRKKIEWNIGYTRTNWKNNFNKDKITKITNPKNRWFADPFVIKKGKFNFIFFEDYSLINNKGSISCIRIDKKNKIKHFKGVLEENFHLSFPFIFKYNKEFYMIPETKAINEIRIYKCESFPLKWKYYYTIKKNISAVDSMIFEHNDIWWLFTNYSHTKNGSESELNIFFSCDGPFTNNWQSHKLNPLITDSFSARNAGLIIENNQIYRCAHEINSFDKGKRTKIFKIHSLSKDEFIEEQLLIIDPSEFNGAFSTHHIYSTNDFTVLDICRKKIKIF